MANDLSIVLEGTLTNTNAALTSGGAAYTVPASRKLIILEMSLVNKTGADQTATLTAGNSTTIFPGKTVPKNDGYLQTRQTQVLTGKQVMGVASANSAIDYYLSCLEVDA